MYIRNVQRSAGLMCAAVVSFVGLLTLLTARMFRSTKDPCRFPVSHSLRAVGFASYNFFPPRSFRFTIFPQCSRAFIVVVADAVGDVGVDVANNGAPGVLVSSSVAGLLMLRLPLFYFPLALRLLNNETNKRI